MDSSCAICANRYDDASASLAEKPRLRGRDLLCCGRSICSRCLNLNKRYETYCPYCQITNEPSLLPQGLRDPPAYSSLHAQTPPRFQTPPNEDRPPAYSSQRPIHAQSEKSNGDEPAQDVLHFLMPNDSMLSLAFAYGIPIDMLRKTNNVYSDHLLQGRKTVLIPGEYYKGGISLSPHPIEGEEEELRKNKIRRWMVGCKVAEYDVALLYLQQTTWNLDAAIAAYKDDERWEREHPLEAKRNGKAAKRAKDVGMRRFVGGGPR